MAQKEALIQDESTDPLIHTVTLSLTRNLKVSISLWMPSDQGTSGTKHHLILRYIIKVLHYFMTQVSEQEVTAVIIYAKEVT